MRTIPAHQRGFILDTLTTREGNAVVEFNTPYDQRVERIKATARRTAESNRRKYRDVRALSTTQRSRIRREFRIFIDAYPHVPRSQFYGQQAEFYGVPRDAIVRIVHKVRPSILHFVLVDELLKPRT